MSPLRGLLSVYSHAMRRLLLPAAILALLVAAVFAGPMLHGEVFQLRDHSDYFQPLRYFTAEQIRSGFLPLWNPYNASGEPWLANPQTGVFYPPAWLFLILPFRTAYMLFLAFHLVLLGWGALLLFSRNASPPAALAGAVTVMLCGPALSLLDVQNNFTTFAWLPLVIWCALASRRSVSIAYGIAPIVLMMSFLGGEPYLALIGAAIYACAALVPARDLESRHPVRNRRASRPAIPPPDLDEVAGRDAQRLRAGCPLSKASRRLAVTGLLAMALSAVQLLPFLELLRGSDRLASQRAEEVFRESMNPADWLRTAVPLAAGDDFQAASQHFVPSLYSGAAVILLALFALLALRDERANRRLIAAWLALFAAVVIVAAGSFVPVVARLTLALHLALSRYPARVAAIGVLAVAGLAVTGLEMLLSGSGGRRRWAGLLIAAAMVAAATLSMTPAQPLASFVAAATCGLLFLLPAAPDALRRVLPFAVALLLAFELLLASRPLLRTGPFDPHLPWSAEIGATEKVIRVPTEAMRAGGAPAAFDRRSWIAGYCNLYEHRFDASTAAPVTSMRYSRLHDAALLRARLDLLAQMSVGYVLTAQWLRHPALQPVAQSPAVHVYRLRGALPLATFWGHVRKAPNDDEALRAAVSRIDPRRTLVVSGLTGPEPVSSALPFPARITELRGSTVRVEVDAPGDGVLLLAQQDAPGWRLFVDGRETPKLRAAGVFRAAQLNAGHHEVEWRYFPRSLSTGAAVTLLTLAGMAAFHLRRRS
jgi:Bacterial membrane protein YfhO